jgi:uncharacterized protein
MANLIIASTRKSAGKTGLAMGLAQVVDKTMGYIKPLGDRLLYRKKRLWDLDASVLISVLGNKAAAEELTIGFEQAKLRYMYNEQQVLERLDELVQANSTGAEHLLIEGGSTLAHGTSVHLDPFSVARHVGGKVILVAGGGEDAIVDDIAYVKRYVDTQGVELAGVVANQVVDPDDFAYTHLDELKKHGIKVLGVIPRKKELSRVSMKFIADCLFARVMAAEGNLEQPVHHLFVGAMSADSIMRDPLFQKKNKLFITSGDRSDLILAALESSTAGIVLSNNILPPPHIVSRAAERNVPLLLVPSDTFQVAKQLDDMEPLVTRDDPDKIAMWAELVREHVDLSWL